MGVGIACQAASASAHMLVGGPGSRAEIKCGVSQLSYAVDVKLTCVLNVLSLTINSWHLSSIFDK